MQSKGGGDRTEGGGHGSRRAKDFSCGGVKVAADRNFGLVGGFPL